MASDPGLYLVPTPIGNLKDITLRALEILKEVDRILAEDTRTTGVLLKHYGISTALKSYHAHNEHKIMDSVIGDLLNGRSMALVSEAGTPGISDPGFLLIRECIRNGIRIECLPGATALIPALIDSGFPTDRFVFEGFLPVKKGRKKRMEALTREERTVILYESTHRIMKTLNQLMGLLGPYHQVAVSRELTKVHEETIRGTLDDVIRHFERSVTKGEFVLIISSPQK